MTSDVTLYFFTIRPIIGSYHPAFGSCIAVGGFQNAQKARDEIKSIAMGGNRPTGDFAYNQSFARENHLDVWSSDDEKTVLAFELDSDCECSFDRSQPFLEVPIAGSPNNVILKSAVYGNGAIASLEFKKGLASDFSRIPIVFNFVDNDTGISPFFMQPHTKHIADSTAKHGGGNKTHGGIHPPTVATNVRLFP